MYNLKEGASSFETPEDGRYLLKVEAVEVKPHEKEGKAGHAFDITFVSADGKFKGRVWEHIYLPWVTWKMKALLEAGGSKEAENENATPTSIAAALQGLEVSAYIWSELGTNKKMRTNVKEYKPASVQAELEGASYEVPERPASDLR